jgi:ABC-type lipoprotein release transport system permease subunit
MAEQAAEGRPLLASGHWLDHAAPDGVVVQASLAQALLVGPGDTLSLSGTGRTLRVLGVADSGEPGYRAGEQPGLIWALILKAIGFTPAQVVRVFLLQHVAFALLGAMAAATLTQALG